MASEDWESVGSVFERSGCLATLAFPDVLAARAGDGFRGMLLGHGIFTNRTIFLPHNYTLVDFSELA